MPETSSIQGKKSLRELLEREIRAVGAVAVGFAKACEVDSSACEAYNKWLAEGNHAGMDYLERHASLKTDPRNVLETVSSVISIAFNYTPAEWRSPDLPAIAPYAYGEDYHDVLRQKLDPVVTKMKELFGGDWRICIDSAPLPERYWAIKSGIGKRGMNGSVIIDGIGSRVFLVELLTSLSIDSISSDENIAPAVALGINCLKCGECVRSCPTGALRRDGTIDSRRCINYLTIEHKGDWTTEGLEAMHTEAGRHSLFGCDICQNVCPHNQNVPPTMIREFAPRPYIKIPKTAEETDILDCKDCIMSMTQADFSRIFKGSPIKRVKLAGLLRNASNLKS